MSDNEKSGEPTSAAADLPAPAPADAPVKGETPPAENAGSAVAAASSPAPAVGAFGSTRGSGLARGKRPTTPSGGAAPAASPGSYKPTSIEVIQTPTEYKNPFTGETSVNAPRVNEPAPQAAPVPTPPPPPPAKAPAPQLPATPPSASEDGFKPELKILPPEQPKRAPVRWESAAAQGEEPTAAAPQSREERPTFRPDRERRDNREPRSFDPREPRPPRREDRRFEPRNQPQPNQERPQPNQERRPEPAVENKPAGFVGWLKGLFGGKKDETAAKPNLEPRRDGDFGQPGQRHRHRGGRGRGHGGGGGYQGGGYQNENRDPRPDGQPGGGQPRGGEQSEGEFGGQRRRRRRRGGRGRNRGEPRPEGQQGGGAI